MNSGLLYLSTLKGWVGQRDFSLGRIREVARFLGDPQDGFKSILIAGTNGKGSTSKVLASVLLSSGLRVGLYTSPHLYRVNERIQIQGQDITNEVLSDYASRVKSVTDQNRIVLSQFEVLTLISFLVFRDFNLDYAVIEVGLGGRLDATNIISKPDISIITSISLDHQDILGDNLASIAIEKAGIIREGSVLLLGSLPEDARTAIFNKLCEKTQVFEFNHDFNAKESRIVGSEQRLIYTDCEGSLELTSSLVGQHQLNNIALAVKAARLLSIETFAIKNGTELAKWPARLERFDYKGKGILIDSAHNLAGVLAAIEYAKDVDFNPNVIVFGALKSKNWKDMIKAIGLKVEQWLIAEADSEVAVSDQDIGQFISDHEMGEAYLFGKDYDRILAHISDLPQSTNVLLLGSIYLVGVLRQKLLELS